MRRTLYAWLIGLVGVSSIAGCGGFRNSGGCCDGGCAPKRVTMPPAAETSGKKGATVSEPVVEPKLPTPIQTIGARDVVPLPTESKLVTMRTLAVDPIAEENAILEREAAALTARGEIPVVQVLPAPQPIRAIPDQIVQAAVVPNRSAIETTSNTSERMTDTPATIVRPLTVSVVPPPEVSIPPESVDVNEKTIAIKSVHIHLGQAGNYKSITGQVETYRKTLRLRFAAIDQEDAYGGVVVLDGGAELNQLRDGQFIRVVGTLVPSDSRTGSARYRVQAVEVLD